MSRPIVFSIVVPTFNRCEVLMRSIESIVATRRPWPCELIVVDDGSEDGTFEALTALTLPLPFHPIRQINSGAAAARNRGTLAAKGRYLLFLDDDMIVDENILVEHERSLAGGADAVVGDIPLHPELPRTVLTRGVGRWAEQRRRRLESEPGRLTVSDFLTGQLSVRASCFRSARGFDEDLTAGGSFGGEDTDLLLRLRAAQVRLEYNGAAISYQRYVVTPEQNLRQWQEAGRNDATLSRKHPGIGRVLFRQHHGGTATGRLTRAAATLPEPVLRRLRTAISRRAAAGRTDPPTEWAYARMRDIGYWAGARTGGGILRNSLSDVRILAYHAVDHLDDPVIGRWTVTPEDFEAQVTELLRRGHTFIGVDQLLAHFDDGVPLASQSLLLTFDDGYESLMEYAAPILARLGVPAVVCVVSGQLGGHNAWDVRSGATRLPLLTVEQLSLLSDAGWEIAAHTHTHAHLTSLLGGRLRDELIRPRTTLAANGLRPPRLLAYPHGEHDFRVRAYAKRAGYDACLALNGAGASPTATDRFALPRVEVLRGITPEHLAGMLADAVPPSSPEVGREMKAVLRMALDGVPRQRRRQPEAAMRR
ncbi:glycosyltransferase [Actinoplanes sp. NPDC049118]|uniref:glycosyltransferase n=1 Tax=Actinoplanes sp. NPDC049118 TaxID=3155769 RepID=UPI00340CC1A0